MDLVEQINQLVSHHPHVTKEVDLRTELPDSAAVSASKMLPEALSELVTNAIVHNDTERPEVEIVVDPDAGPRYLTEVRITDNGPGMPDYEWEALHRAEEDPLVHLSGMGLWIASRTVKLSRGKFSREENESHGCVIVLHLPKSVGTLTAESFGSLLNPDTWLSSKSDTLS